MNSLDFVVLAVVSITVIIGTLRGGVREAFSFVSFVAGFLLAANYFPYASDSFLRLTSHPFINDAISFVGIFIFSAFLLSFIGGRISAAVRKAGFSLGNALAGTALGALKGALMCTLLAYLLSVFLPADNKTLAGSKTLPYFSRAARAVAPVGRKLFREELGKKMERFEKDKGEGPPKKN